MPRGWLREQPGFWSPEFHAQLCALLLCDLGQGTKSQFPHLLAVILPTLPASPPGLGPTGEL